MSQAQYFGAIARRDFAAGEALVADGLVKASDRGFLAAALSPSHRAVTIAVDASQSAAGLIMPGDRVDVILTQNFADATTDPAHRSVGETVLGDVHVIAVDNWVSGAGKPTLIEQRIVASDLRGPKTVTLDLAPRDAEKLLVAMQIGKIELSVRALAVAQPPTPAPRTPVPTWAADVSPALESLARRPTPPQITAVPQTPAEKQPRALIEVMHGDKIEIR